MRCGGRVGWIREEVKGVAVSTQLAREIAKDAATVVVVLLAGQGALFYISEPVPLPSIAVVAIVMVTVRTLIHIRRARSSDALETELHGH